MTLSVSIVLQRSGNNENVSHSIISFNIVISCLLKTQWATVSQPNLYYTMIYTFLIPAGDLDDDQLFPNQNTIELVLLLLSLIVVPWMLLPEPFILKAQHNRVEATHDPHLKEELQIMYKVKFPTLADLIGYRIAVSYDEIQKLVILDDQPGYEWKFCYSGSFTSEQS
ncbi:V-type proton ATPase subunit A2 [Tanacetum coccineum]